MNEVLELLPLLHTGAWRSLANALSAHVSIGMIGTFSAVWYFGRLDLAL